MGRPTRRMVLRGTIRRRTRQFQRAYRIGKRRFYQGKRFYNTWKGRYAQAARYYGYARTAAYYLM